MTLQAEVVVARDEHRLDVSVSVEPGEVVALVGPNGAGKTTLLRAIAGLQPLTSGKVTVGDRVLTDTAVGVDIEAADRGVGMVFQDYLLFPHLNVASNVGFGRGVGDGASLWLERFNLTTLAARMPDELSGGEAQRVALARAMAVEPEVLLLDEPLAALDVESRHAIRRQLGEHLAQLEVPVMIVTHDPIDAGILANRIVVLEDGKITQEGTLPEITARPRSAWTARLAGANLYRGVAEGHSLQIAEGGILTLPEQFSGDVFATIAPQAVAIHVDRPSGSPRNVWSGRVAGVEPTAGRFRVVVEGTPPVVAEITGAAAEALDLGRLDEVWVSVKAAEIEAYQR